MRARNIKPGVFESERVGSVSMMARILYMGLWCLADRLGRLEDRPLKIKGLLFRFDPITTGDVDAALKELANQGLIIRYSVDGARFIEVCNFLKHQTPHHKERASIIPEPTKEGASTDLGACKPPLNPDSLIPDILNPESSLREKNTGCRSAAPTDRSAGSTNEDKEAEWREWLDAFQRKAEAEGAPKNFTPHAWDEFCRCAREYYADRGGRLTPTRLLRVAKAMDRFQTVEVCFALEIYCDSHGATKDERYLVGIARRIARLSDAEFAADMKRHRDRMKGMGIYSGRPK